MKMVQFCDYERYALLLKSNLHVSAVAAVAVRVARRTERDG